ncbi:MAG: hypothetical protein H0T58_01870 [Gemmatimonadales bacterium]|nr:hypothetical protein [Gemmatimonadales bacterium]
MRLSAAALIPGFFLAAGCNSSVNQDDGAGRLEARWTGADSGRLAASTTAEWCGERRALEIRAVQGDTGLAMVLYPLDSIEADTYLVSQPEAADSLAPSAGVALRLFSTNSVQGYQGDSGSVVLTQSSSGELSGRLAVSARSVVNGRPLTLTGKFQGLVVMPQSRGCGPDAADSTETYADSADTYADSIDFDDDDASTDVD